jgi:hypothetical protein
VRCVDSDIEGCAGPIQNWVPVFFLETHERRRVILEEAVQMSGDKGRKAGGGSVERTILCLYPSTGVLTRVHQRAWLLSPIRPEPS